MSSLAAPCGGGAASDEDESQAVTFSEDDEIGMEIEMLQGIK